MSHMWINGINNKILKEPGKDFYVEYNTIKGSPVHCVTALVDNHDKHYVLNGDFRQEYEARYNKGFHACKKYFNKMKPICKSVWSD